MSETFTGLLRTLKSTSSAKDSSLLSSCETELNELMRQIDIMVANKRMEWEHQVQGMQVQYDRKERESTKLKETVELRNQEIGQLQQCLEGQEEGRRNLIAQYEEQLSRLQSEMDNLKKNYGKLQRNASRQISEAEGYKEQMMNEREKKDHEIKRAKLKENEFQDQVHAFKNTNAVQMQQLAAMEEQKRSLMEKSELMQEQLLGYQGQLTRKKQLLDSLEQKHVMKIAELENEILQYRDSMNAQEETNKSLKKSLEDAKADREKDWNQRLEMKEQMQDMKRTNKKLEQDISQLKKENTPRMDRLQRKDEEIESLNSQVQTLQKQVKKKDEELRDVDISSMQFADESELIKKLQRSISKYQHEIELKSVQNEVLSQKTKQQERRLHVLDTDCRRLREELANKAASGATETGLDCSKSDLLKLQNLLHQKEEEQKAEIAGMKQQISSLSENLHRRDLALADLSERGTKMEQDFRDVTSKHDKKTAELQVSNAQLEALRLENRHLREASTEEHLSSTADMQMFETHLMEVKNNNARTVAQLEDENEFLKHELQHLEDTNISRDSTQRRIPNDESQSPSRTGARISTLQQQLDATINNYEDKMQTLTQENEDLRASISQDISNHSDAHRSHDQIEESLRQPNRGSPQYQESVDRRDDMDFSNLFDLLENTSASSGTSPRRQSVTTDFASEEQRREEQLQKLLQERISDLEKKTSLTLQKYLL